MVRGGVAKLRLEANAQDPQDACGGVGSRKGALGQKMEAAPRGATCEHATIDEISQWPQDNDRRRKIARPGSVLLVQVPAFVRLEDPCSPGVSL